MTIVRVRLFSEKQNDAQSFFLLSNLYFTICPTEHLVDNAQSDGSLIFIRCISMLVEEVFTI